MTSLQEYLNQKYPTKDGKEGLKKINSAEIRKEQEGQGLTELLEGRNLDLREFKNLEEVRIDRKDLKTSLIKVEVDGLTKLKELVWNSGIVEDSEEDKKLFAELGISEDSDKKRAVREIKRLAKLWVGQNNKKVEVYFATGKSPKEQLKDGAVSVMENKEGNYNIYLNLERKDKLGGFSFNLVLWALIQELTTIGFSKYDKDPLYWNHFWDEGLKWVKENVVQDYQKEWEALLNPSSFLRDKLEMKELYRIYFPILKDEERKDDGRAEVKEEIVDKVWVAVRRSLMEIIGKEVKKGDSTEERLKKLGVELTIDYSSDKSNYSIVVHYNNSQNPVKKEIEGLILTTPLKLEIEYLKQKQEKLPTRENFDKLVKQNQVLDDHLQDTIDKKNYQGIKEGIEKIN